MEKLIQLYQETWGAAPSNIEKIAQSGSNRQYFRLSGPEVPGGSVIGVVGQSVDENRAFIYLTKHFTLRRLPVPKILAVSEDEMRYIQTDLGKTSLYDALSKGRNAGGRYTLSERRLLEKTIEALPELQYRGARGLDFTKCYPAAEFDRTSVLFDLYYFKYCFLKAIPQFDFHELKLEAAFQLMADDLTSEHSESFLYRDFQARNVILSDEDQKPCFIDYQGGRRGPVEYDVASFLWQASARYSPQLREELIDRYIASARHYFDIAEKTFRRRLPLFVLFRLLQVLGAYGFRGYYERKEHFLKSIPPAIANVRDMLSRGACPYPYLNEILSRLTEMPQFQEKEEKVFKRDDGYRIDTSNIYQSHKEDGKHSEDWYKNHDNHDSHDRDDHERDDHDGYDHDGMQHMAQPGGAPQGMMQGQPPQGMMPQGAPQNGQQPPHDFRFHPAYKIACSHGDVKYRVMVDAVTGNVMMCDVD